MVVMTAPMIGNYGINPEDIESDRPRVAGVVVRELSLKPSNWRSTGSLLDWLSEAKVPVVADVDTRQLTRHIRSQGAMRGVMAVGDVPTDAVRQALTASPSMDGLDLASAATITAEYREGSESAKYHVVAYDYGMKRNILRLFMQNDCRVTVVPAGTTGAYSRARAGWVVSFERAGRSRRRRLRHHDDPRVGRRRAADFRDLSRPSAARPRLRRPDDEAALWPPRRQPSGARS
jgi:carbamoyl-phosphate synthase small subunit